MPEPIVQEGQSSTIERDLSQKPYQDIIKKASAFDIDWLRNDQLQSRQEAILNELPQLELLANELTDFIKRERKKEDENARRLGKEPQHSPVKTLVRGELHERLVALENKLFITNNRPTLPVENTDRWADPALEDSITKVLRDPPFVRLASKRKPDLSYVEARQGNLVVITGTGEAKSGKTLNRRAYRQLCPDGFRKTLEILAEEVNGLTRVEASQRGLEGFGKGGMRLAILQKFTQYVYMCRDVDVRDHKSLIVRTGPKPEDHMTDEEYADFLAILEGRSEKSKVVILNSSFSEKELDRLRDAVLPLVESNLST